MLQRRVKNKAKPQSGNQSSKILHITQTGIVLYTHFTVKRKKKGKKELFFFLEGNHHLNILAQKNFLPSSAEQKMCEKMSFLQKGGKQFLA